MTDREAQTDNQPGQRHWRLPHWLRSPAGAALLVAVFFGLLGTVTMLAEIGRPFGGFLSYGFLTHADAEFGHDTPNWWPVLVNGTLRYGDLLLNIDGRPFTPNARAAFAAAYDADRPVTLDVFSRVTGERRTATVPVVPVVVADVLDVKFAETIVGVVFLLLAALVLRARPRHVTNQVFAVTAACVAVHRLTVNAAMTNDGALFVNLPKTGHMIAAGFMGTLLVHLAYVFPTPRPRRPRWLLPLLYALGALSGLVQAIGRLPFWAGVPQNVDAVLTESSFAVMMYLLLGGILALFGRLIWSWRRERQTRRQKSITRVILLGLLFSLPAVIVILAPLLPGLEASRTAFWFGMDVRFLMLTIPIAFAYVIIRYQTFQGLSKLFIFILVLSFSGMLAALGAWLWRLGMPPEAAAIRPPTVTIFALVFLSSLFWSMQGSWRGWFGRYLHWEPRTYDAARAFGGRVMASGAMSLRELPPTMAGALADELALERAAIWLWSPEANCFILAAAVGIDGVLPERLPAPAGWLAGRATPVHPADLAPAWLGPLAGDERIEVVVPLVAAGAPLGLLGLGRRWDEEIFDDRDLAVADLVGQQATLFLQTAVQVEELRRVPGRVAAAQERERLRVAGELHDTIQQFLGRLPFFLAVSRDRVKSDPEGAAELLDRCLTDVEEAAAMLRRIRVNLAPNQLESNLLLSLQGLASHVRQRSGLEVSLDAPADLDDTLNPETRHALYRVIQQALDNAVAHAEARQANVWLARQDGRVVFSVRDDGRGSSVEQRQAAQEAGSFGLKSMQARLELCGGALQFDSAPGAGTTVGGWVPAAGGGVSTVL